MRQFTAALFLTVLSALPAVAQDWALGGFDPVGYANAGRAVPGRSDIATMWRGKLWHFASEENRARFEADPRSFAPDFDGICPVSLSEGRPQRGDPRHFAVFKGHLYLMRSGAAERTFLKNTEDVLDHARMAFQGSN
ncbi:MAG: hypothetical protein L0G27_00490 [Paracoccus sp. (in: a-proteobacteria)]|nr:hypothetical protein [Paracoccus sp. (in: a-proteobacteria)]